MFLQRLLLVLVFAHGTVLAAPVPKTTTDADAVHASASADAVATRTCAELIEETYGCSTAAGSCGLCVTRAWPRLRNEAACAGLGHGELVQHCGPVHDAADESESDDGIGMSGLFKSTWAASDPVNTTLPALMKYLTVESTLDSCPGQVCACGECGRTQMLPSGTVQFGLHTVAAKGINDCRSTSPLSGDLTVADVEAIFDEELGDMSTYSPYMDYNAMLWTPATTLDSYRQAFDADGVLTLKLQWPCFYDDSETTCYSLIWHIPQSMVTIEIASNQTATPDDFVVEGFPRHEFVTKELPTHDYAEPLHDSRAVDDIDEIIDWYDRVLGVSPTATREGADSSVTVVFAYPSSSKMGHDANIQYVYRPATGSKSQGTSTSWLQSYWNSVSDKYMTNMTSMWPIW